MKSSIQYICFCIFVFAGCARISSNNVESQGSDARVVESRTQAGALPSTLQRLRIENQSGRVIICGTNDHFGWQHELKCHAIDEKTAREFADRCKLEADGKEGEYHLILRMPKGRNQPAIESNLRVCVPQSVSVEVNNSFGPVELARIGGSAKVRNQSGAVSLNSISGEIDAANSFGAMHVENTGPAALRNQSGSIQADDISGELSAETSFASLSARRVKGPAELKNQSGSIAAENIEGPISARTSFATLRVAETGPADLANQSGLIEARVVGGDLKAVTSFASLEARKIHGQAELSNQSGAIEASEIEGAIKARTSFARMSLEGRSPVIDARNQSGSIDIAADSGQTTRIQADTSFAPLHVLLPTGSRPMIAAHTSGGKIESDFPVLQKKVSEEELRSDPAPFKVILNNQNGEIRVKKSGAK